MYTGSYYNYDMLEGKGYVTISSIALLALCVTLFILPIICAVKYNCTNKKLIIPIHIVTALFMSPFNSIISFILIAVNKRNSRYYEDTGKNIAWLQCGFYILSFLSVFMPIAKLRDSAGFYIEDVKDSYNTMDLISSSEFFGEEITNFWRFVFIALICLPIIGLVLNFIFRDARKLIAVNLWIPLLSTVIVYTLANNFYSMTFMPGFGIGLNAATSIAFAVVSYIVAVKVSYVDN